MQAWVLSFGVSNESGMIFDRLCARINRHWDLDRHLIVDVRNLFSDSWERTRAGTARFPAVRSSIMEQKYAAPFVELMCRDLISHRILCVACTSGKHRSATLAIEAAVTLRRAGWAVEEVHLGLLWHEGFWTSKQGLENWLDDLAARVMRTCAVVQAPTSLQYCWCTSFVQSVWRSGFQSGACRCDRAEEAYNEYFCRRGTSPYWPWRSVCHQFWRTGRCRYGCFCRKQHVERSLDDFRVHVT